MRFLIFIILFFIPLSLFSWSEVDCSKISKQTDVLNSNYKPSFCQKYNDSEALGYITESFDGTIFMSIEMQRIIASNTVWGNDYVYQELKEENIEDLIKFYSMGKPISISTKANKLKSNNKIVYRYKSFETSDGKGFFGGGTVGKMLWTFTFYSKDKSIDAMASRENKTSKELAYDILLENQGKNFIYAPLVNYSNNTFDVCRAMLKDKNAKDINFQGIAVGDGWTGCKPKDGEPADWCIDLDNVGVFKYPNVHPGPWYDIEFFHGHSQFSNELYNEIQSTCTEEELKGTVTMGPACLALIGEMSDEIGYWFPYNLYNACPAGAMLNSKNINKHGMNRALKARREFGKAMKYNKHLASDIPSAGNGDSGLGSPCLGHAMSTWFTLNETLEIIFSVS